MNTKSHLTQNTSKVSDKAVSCITYPERRHFGERTPCLSATVETSPPPVAAVDWYEIGAVVTWRKPSFPALEEARLRARATRRPVEFRLGQLNVLVYGRGIGQGRDSYLRYCIGFGGIFIGVSDRQSISRKLYNFRFIASGYACVVIGLEGILDIQRSLIQSLNGHIEDSWVKRIDICLDIPANLSIDVLIRKLKEGCFATSSRRKRGQGGPIDFYDSGFAIPSKGVRCTAYDKLAEIKEEARGEEYLQAMVHKRWGGVIPRSAIRVEYQFSKEYLFRLNIRNATDALARLGEIVAHATTEGPNPFFRITESPPDKKNRHHHRSKTDSDWRWIVEHFQKAFPMARAERDVMRLLLLRADDLPFEEPIRRNEAATTTERRSERWLPCDSVPPGIEQSRSG